MKYDHKYIISTAICHVSKMWTADVGTARCDIYLNKYFLHLKKEM